MVLGCFYSHQKINGRTVEYCTAPIRKLMIDNDQVELSKLLDESRVRNARTNTLLVAARSGRATRSQEKRLIPVELVWGVILMYGFRENDERSRDQRVYEQLIVLCVLLIYGYGIRPGNLLYDSKAKGEHTLRARMMILSFSSGEPNRPPLAYRAHEVRSVSPHQRCCMHNVSTVLLAFESGKNVGSVRTAKKKPLKILLTNHGGTFQGTICEYLYAHLMEGDLAAEDFVTSLRRQGEQKQLRMEDVVSALWSVCDFFGMSRKGVTATAFRSTCFSILMKLGEDHSVAIGNWSTRQGAVPRTYLQPLMSVKCAGDLPGISFAAAYSTILLEDQRGVEKLRGYAAANPFEGPGGEFYADPEPLIVYSQRGQERYGDDVMP